ncbi:uncharacterized protein G2W53_028870 [Senna tora]|uniref:Uncharacterized protein n=1 Tax=Senna tora TaxID=362788 RepID=A0A834T4B0_9FABA|nr:uncharacterized protein G2W53_028870 [Senna tora]
MKLFFSQGRPSGGEEDSSNRMAQKHDKDLTKWRQYPRVMVQNFPNVLGDAYSLLHKDGQQNSLQKIDPRNFGHRWTKRVARCSLKNIMNKNTQKEILDMEQKEMIKMHLHAVVKEKEKEKVNLCDQCSKVIRLMEDNVVLKRKVEEEQLSSDVLERTDLCKEVLRGKLKESEREDGLFSMDPLFLDEAAVDTAGPSGVADVTSV